MLLCAVLVRWARAQLADRVKQAARGADLPYNVFNETPILKLVEEVLRCPRLYLLCLDSPGLLSIVKLLEILLADPSSLEV